MKQLSGKKLYVMDAYCGSHEDTRMSVRFIMEVAWQAHFVKNMFIRPSEEELENFVPDFTVYCASKAEVENYRQLGLNSLSMYRPTPDVCVSLTASDPSPVIVREPPEI